MNEIIDTTGRTAETIAAEIRMIEEQAARILIHSAIQIGQRLVEAKSMVEDGKWLQYIKTELNYEKSTAQNYMRLYKEYGSDQTSIFDTFSKTETFRRLTTTKALALLQVPKEDREAFAAEHNIDEMSTRELQKAIRERDAAIAEKDAVVAACEQSQEEVDRIRNEAERAHEKVEKLEAEAKETARKLNNSEAEIEKLRGQVRDAQKNEADAKVALKKAKENPDIPESLMAQLRAEVEAEAMAKATQAAEQKLEAATKEQESIREQLRRSEEQLETARKELQLQNPEASVFKVVFEQVQQDFNRLNGTLIKLRLSDPELAAKLTKATVALLDKLKNDVAE